MNKFRSSAVMREVARLSAKREQQYCNSVNIVLAAVIISIEFTPYSRSIQMKDARPSIIVSLFDKACDTFFTIRWDTVKYVTVDDRSFGR